MQTYSKSVLTALILSTSPLLAVTTIGVNFNNNDGAGGQNDGNFSATWTNVNVGASGSGLAVNGTGGAVALGWASSNYWQAGSYMSTTTGNAFNTTIGLMRVYLDDGDGPAAGSPPAMGAVAGDGIGASVSLVGMSAWLAAEGATSYTIRAFFSTDNGSSFGAITARNGAAVNSPALETITPVVQGNGLWDGTTVDAGGNDAGGIRGDALFATGFTQDSLTLTMPSNAGAVRNTLAGFIVTAVIPEPASALLGCFALPLLFRRRR